jgi:citrate lyase subunit beta/citryl-CoA lyase
MAARIVGSVQISQPVPSSAAAAADLAKAGKGPRVFVRTNTSDSIHFERDLEVATAEGVEGIVLPKVESAEQVTHVERAMTRLERSVGIYPRLMILGIESVAGVEQSVAITTASTRACALYFGAEDFATDIGGRRTPSNAEVAYARSRVVMAARLGLAQSPRSTRA